MSFQPDYDNPFEHENHFYLTADPTRMAKMLAHIDLYKRSIGLAGAIVMYDRMIYMGRFAERPVRAGAPTETLQPHVHGGPRLRHLES